MLRHLNTLSYGLAYISACILVAIAAMGMIYGIVWTIAHHPVWVSGVAFLVAAYFVGKMIEQDIEFDKAEADAERRHSDV